MAGIYMTAAILVGILSFVLFVLSLAVAEGWLSSTELMNQSTAALAVYGVISGGGAIGMWQLGKDEV
jgi:hypothetical protein